MNESTIPKVLPKFNTSYPLTVRGLMDGLLMGVDMSLPSLIMCRQSTPHDHCLLVNGTAGTALRCKVDTLPVACQGVAGGSI